MTDELKQKIKDQLQELPKDSQEAINSFDWLLKIQEIAKENNLSDEEADNLAIETIILMTGNSYPDEYAENVEDGVGTTKDEAEKIADEVLEKVFEPIAEKIEVKIKNKIKESNPKFDQNVKFTLSGGDYSYFMEQKGVSNGFIETIRAIRPDNTPEIKDTSRIGNLKSKFTI